MLELWRRLNNVVTMVQLLWWAIVLPHRRFDARLNGFCSQLIQQAGPMSQPDGPTEL